MRKIKSDINILLIALVIVVFINNTSDDDDTNIGMNLLNRSKVIMIKLLIFYWIIKAKKNVQLEIINLA